MDFVVIVVDVAKGSMHSSLDKGDRFDSWEGNAVDLRVINSTGTSLSELVT